MASLFDIPRWDRQPQPVGLELSRTHRDIHHALEDSALFQTGLQAVPQGRKQVSLQAVGSAAPTGPAAVGSPETMQKIGSGSNDPLRERMIDTLQTPGRGWQFGPQGSAAGVPAKPQLTPVSTEKPALVGGIPQGSPQIKTGSENVRVGGFVISPQGTIETQIPSLAGLAPLNTLAAPQFDVDQDTLGTADTLEDTDKVVTPAFVRPITRPGFQPSKSTLGVSISPSLIPPISIPSAIVPLIQPISLEAIPAVVPEVAPELPPPLPLPLLEVEPPGGGEEAGGGDEGGGGEAGGDAGGGDEGGEGDTGGEDDGDAGEGDEGGDGGDAGGGGSDE